MKHLVGILTLILLLADPAFGVAGIDRVFQKPPDRKTWGQLLADYVGYSGYSKSYALVVGISIYRDYKKLPTANDPISVKDFLINIAGFDYVHLLTEEYATESRVRELMVDEFPRLVDSNDRFLFYWSGHGATRPVRAGARGYLVLASTRKDKYSDMISMNDIQRWDDLLRAYQTLYLLDSCFSGLAGSVPQSDTRALAIEQMARRSRHLMSAGTADQQTIATDSLGGSIFTTALLDGLSGAADSSSEFPRDGLVTVKELDHYIKLRVAIERRKAGWKKSITPQLRDLSVNEGEFFFVTKDRKASPLKGSNTQFVFGEPVSMSPDNFSSEEIREVQERLAAIGFNPGPVDGIFGPATSKALRLFQTRKGLKITGELDRLTWNMLKRQKLPYAFTNSIGMQFVYIDPGSFTMGSPKGEKDRDDDEIEHQVRLSQGYYMGRTEVTVGQFRKFVKDTGYKTEAETDGGAYVWTGEGWEKKAGRYWDAPGFDQAEDHPVTCVSWNDVQKFIDWLNNRDDRRYRLPTEAEWEYAARAGSRKARYWGDDSESACRYANVADRTAKQKFPEWRIYECEDGYAYTSPVGRYLPNEFGLHDMIGNVLEWCRDWYGEYPDGSVTDPKGPSSGTNRVLRGGSWGINPRFCRSAYRFSFMPGFRNVNDGFRLVAPSAQQNR